MLTSLRGIQDIENKYQQSAPACEQTLQRQLSDPAPLGLEWLHCCCTCELRRADNCGSLPDAAAFQTALGAPHQGSHQQNEQSQAVAGVSTATMCVPVLHLFPTFNHVLSKHCNTHNASCFQPHDAEGRATQSHVALEAAETAVPMQQLASVRRHVHSM
jgi:hypothetical protein